MASRKLLEALASSGLAAAAIERPEFGSRVASRESPLDAVCNMLKCARSRPAAALARNGVAVCCAHMSAKRGPEASRRDERRDAFIALHLTSRRSPERCELGASQTTDAASIVDGSSPQSSRLLGFSAPRNQKPAAPLMRLSRLGQDNVGAARLFAFGTRFGFGEPKICADWQRR